MKEVKSKDLTVFVVWEPILPTDWSRPMRLVLGRIPDARVLQFWDRGHVISQQLNAQLTDRQPSCCWAHETLWDLTALYPAGTRWDSSGPVFIDGPVVKVKAELARQVSKLLQ